MSTFIARLRNLRIEAARPLNLFWLFAIGATVLGIAGWSADYSIAAERKPNIVVFLVDDMGWMDSGVYGSKYYETPNIDRLAAKGELFTDAYAANPLCSPTRASILTGKYPARHGITNPSGHMPPQPPGHVFLPATAPPSRAMIEPESKHYLEPEEYTIAEALHAAGYRTAHFGKWHLGLTPPHWPDKQGFDVAWHGKPDPGPASYFSPYGFKAYQSFPDGPPGEYITDRLTDEALKFVEANRDQPFLLHMWQYGVHGPWGHKEEYTKQFVDKKDPRGEQGNPIMASMLKSVDESLGRLVAKLDELGIADNTAIIFSSDNGGNIHSNIDTDPKLAKRKDLKGLAKTRADDWQKWAGNQPPTNNAPLRSGKSWLFEGGIRVPLIVVWPGKVKAGSKCSTPVCSIDFYPTMLDIAGVKRKAGQIIDGQSLMPLLTGQGTWNREALFNYFPHGAGNKPPGVTVRVGDWKLIRWFSPTREFPEPLELYNLRDDLSETNNLASSQPAKVKELDALIDGFLKDTGALYPRPNPDYKPKLDAAGKPQTVDPLKGWKEKHCTAVVTDGALRVTADGHSPFLGTSQLKVPGPAIVDLRVRTSAGGPGKIQWRTADQETFPMSGQIVPFELKASDDWQNVAVQLPVHGELVHLRLFLPAEESPVDIASVKVLGAKSTRPVREWKFDAVK